MKVKNPLSLSELLKLALTFLQLLGYALDRALLALYDLVELLPQLTDVRGGVEVCVGLLPECRDGGVDLDDAPDLSEQEVIVRLHLQHLIVISRENFIELRIFLKVIKPLLLALHTLLEVLSLKLVLQLELLKVDGELASHALYLSAQVFDVGVLLVAFEPRVGFDPHGQCF